MKKRLLSMLLVMVLIVSLLPAAIAADSFPEIVDQNTADTSDQALHMQKTLTKNQDGSYDITIESWATGEVDSHVITEAIPTDFVLVLDQSGSMDTEDIPATYTDAGNSWKPSDLLSISSDGSSAQAHTYYYKVPDANEYYEVYYKDDPVPSGITALSRNGIKTYTTDNNRKAVTYNGKNVFYKDGSGAYHQVYLETSQPFILHYCTLFYYDSNGNRHDLETRVFTNAGILSINADVRSQLYTIDNGSHRYGLYYRDASGVEHAVDGSTIVPSVNDVFYNDVLYTKGEETSRLEALRSAVSSFVSLVQEMSHTQQGDVAHRVALVGFADRDSNNTEILTGNGGVYSDGISNARYQAALQDVTQEAGLNNLRAAIRAIDANGGTEPQYGFVMAENILEKRTEKTYINSLNQTADRNTVVLFFTDGHPGNYDYSDQVEAANVAVSAARNIKQNEWSTKIFSVGIFASGDDQPLTFTTTNQRSAEDTSRTNYLYYRGGYYYLRGNDTADIPYSDTIAWYMRSVSYEYPDAVNFLNHNSNTDNGRNDNQRGRSENTSYYMRVTDADGLRRAFETVASSIDTSSTAATLDSEAVLKDTVYTSDFDVSGAVVEAKAVKIKTVGDHVEETGAPGESRPVVTDTVSANGTLSVTNFDYSEHYTDSTREGEKLVVTIRNLLPAVGGHLYSNNGDAKIYANSSSSDTVLGVASPEENIAKISHVIDFNAKMILAENVQKWKPVGAAFNGVFDLSDGTFTYQLLPDQVMPKDHQDQISLVMQGVDKALALDTDVDWAQYTAIPANNVYFDDDLLNGDAIQIGDGSGYNENVATAASSGAQIVNESGAEVYYFTFAGTGIDIYCTTSAQDGSVQVSLVKGDHFDNANKVYVEDAEGKYVLNEETGAFELANADTPADAQRYSTSSYAVINMSQTTRYNVPTVTYTDLPYGTYTVYLKAMKGCQYKLDGVRIYNALGAPDTLSQEVYSNTDEANARFYTLREGLVNDGEDVSVQATVTNPTTGVLFVDDPDKLYMKDGDGNDFYPDMNAAYKANSPKNEIYLGSGEAIAFNVNGVAGAKYWVGLSVPEEGAESAVVNVNGTTTTVTSAVDMYYPIEPNDGAVTITNNGDAMVSVTKLKVTSPYSAPDAVPDDTKMEPFSVITPKLFRMLANQGVDTQAGVDQPSQDDAVASMKALIKQLISDFVRTLFQSISQLFGK